MVGRNGKCLHCPLPVLMIRGNTKILYWFFALDSKNTSDCVLHEMLTLLVPYGYLKHFNKICLECVMALMRWLIVVSFNSLDIIQHFVCFFFHYATFQKLDWTDWGCGPLTGFFSHSDELLDSITVNFLGRWINIFCSRTMLQDLSFSQRWL
jgi:hypothetical protein